MKAIVLRELGGPDVLRPDTAPDPTPGPGEVVVRVKAAALNHRDVWIRKGLYAGIKLPVILGSDGAGVVEAVGPGVDGVRAGDEVLGFTDDRASQAELVVVEAANLTPKPPEVPWEVAGALHVVGATAWAAVRAVSLREGDVLAVSGAAGGVGTLAVQLARNAGATVIGLASEPHHGWLHDHGRMFDELAREPEAQRPSMAAEGHH